MQEVILCDACSEVAQLFCQTDGEGRSKELVVQGWVGLGAVAALEYMHVRHNHLQLGASAAAASQQCQLRMALVVPWLNMMCNMCSDVPPVRLFPVHRL